MYKDIRGREVVTSKPYEELFELENGINLILRQVEVHNEGESRIHVIINEGDELPLDPNEIITLGNLAISSVVVVEEGSKVMFRGID